MREGGWNRGAQRALHRTQLRQPLSTPRDTVLVLTAVFFLQHNDNLQYNKKYVNSNCHGNRCTPLRAPGLHRSLLMIRWQLGCHHIEVEVVPREDVTYILVAQPN